MLKNFITIALRSFFRQKFYSLINLIGLSTGLTCTLLIYLWVNDELAIDSHHKELDRIFRVVSNGYLDDGSVVTWTSTPGPLGDVIEESIPEVEWVARTMRNGDQLFQVGEKNFLEKGVFADPGLFHVLTFDITEGSLPPTSKEKNWVAISQSLADKLFEGESAVGKSVIVSRQYDLTVSTVYADLGDNSSLHFDFVMPFEIYRDVRGAGFYWGNFDPELYLKLAEGAKSQETIDKVNQLAQTFFPPEDKDAIKFYIQPFSDMYLYSGFENGLPVNGRIKYVHIFSVVAVFILIIACINFMNMATARAVVRAKEVGVRKVVGAHRVNLILQFMGESMLLSTVAMVLAITLTLLILPVFNLLMVKHIELSFDNPILLVSIALIVVITGLLAGSYPALFLSSFQPSRVLKGSIGQSLTGDSLRKSLVIFQFATTIVLVVSALVVFQQVEFIRDKNLGYKRDNIISFVTRGDIGNQFSTFKNEVKQINGVKSVTRTDQSIVQVQNQTGSLNWPGRPVNSQVLFRTIVVDFDFLETMGFELTEGRFFSTQYNDTSNFVLTQKAVEVMGLTNPIGQKLSLWGNDGIVVGVVNDFHSRSLHEAIDPNIFLCKPDNTWRANILLESGNIMETVNQIESVYKKFSPEYPFDYSFLDDDFERLYNNEKVAGRLSFTFTIMAIVISGLGLIGLAAYTAEKRKKEIGIRKTMGAAISSIVTLITKDFVRLCAIAIVIGCPAAYYLMNNFLSGFAYHTDIGLAVFLYTIALILVFTLSVVITQAARAAMVNPVDVLRNE